MIIAQISDSHILAPDSDDPAQPLRANAVTAVVRDINNLADRPDLVIHTGDLVQHRTLSAYRFLRDLLSDLKVPCFLVPGNRDDRHMMADVFPRVAVYDHPESFIHYTIDDYPVRLIAMDSQGLTSFKGHFSKARLDALARAMAVDTSRPTALFMHHPPFEISNARDPFQYETRQSVSDLETLLSRHANIVRIFCGHSHRARRDHLGGVEACTIPSLAPDLRQDIYHPRFNDVAVYQTHHWHDRHGFLSVTRIAR